MAKTVHPFSIGGARVPAGSMWQLELEVARLPIQQAVSLPVMVIHGAKPGATLWINAAVHGDELNGIQVVWRIAEKLDATKMAGTVLLIPVVNVFGFLEQSRYLPDRRDLNRCFPGGARGSLGSRLAHLFLTEIVDRCTHGLDLHTGAAGRSNLPQVRADLEDPDTRAMAEAFGAPVMLHAKQRPGALRSVARSRGKRVLVYEGGGPAAFDEEAIASGTRGVMNVLHHLGIVRRRGATGAVSRSRMIDRTTWLRAKRAGLLRLTTRMGARVAREELLGSVVDLFGQSVAPIRAPADGIVVGLTTAPVVYQGDALVNLGHVQDE